MSASQLGIKAESLGIKKSAKTHKGRKILESRQPKLKENTKMSIMLKGNKLSQTVDNVIKDLHLMRGKEFSKLNLRKAREIYPFDDVGFVEQLASKQDCSLFCVGTH